jgi:hypothetical protein
MVEGNSEKGGEVNIKESAKEDKIMESTNLIVDQVIPHQTNNPIIKNVLPLLV